MAFIAFNKSVRGYQHLLNGTVMQDSSGSWSSPDGRFHIAAAADGHGDRLCARSDRGSAFAIRAAMDALRSFADSYSKNPGVISERLMRERRSGCGGLFPPPLMNHLARCIVSAWRRMVISDAGSSPLTLWEKLLMSDVHDVFHLYGTTLIAALVLDGKHLLLLQQGDGHAAVFFKGGGGSQPELCCSFGEIPWDPRCRGNITTSMCSADVASGIRWSVADLGKRPLIGVFLGSDGIEDSFPKDRAGGTHDLYRTLLLTAMLQRWQQSFAGGGWQSIVQGMEDYLGRYLPGLSMDGSWDDVTVSAIIDPDLAERLSPGSAGGLSLPVCCIEDPGSFGGSSAPGGPSDQNGSREGNSCAVSLFLGGRAGCGFRELMDCWCIPAAGFFCDLRRKGTPAASPDRRMFLSAGGSPKPHLAVDPGALPGNGSFPDPEFTAPELLSGSLSAPSPETDCYTLAVFLFAAMFGCLPYDGRELLGVPCVTSDVMLSFCRNTGRFVFSGGSNSIDAGVDPDAENLWESCPRDVREMFLDVFDRPGKRRPSALEWLRALAFLRNRQDPESGTFAGLWQLQSLRRTEKGAEALRQRLMPGRKLILSFRGGECVPAADGTAVYGCMLGSSGCPSAVIGKVNASQGGHLSFINTSGRACVVRISGGMPQTAEPGKSFALLPGMRIMMRCGLISVLEAG
jgi:hypothetical protein